MDIEQELKRLADLYAAQGYQITVLPKPKDLPRFAKDFKVEIAGKRGAEGVLVTVKRNRDEVAADPHVPRYAEVTGAQPGWRFDLVVLEAEQSQSREVRDAQDFSNEDINRVLNESEQMVRMTFARAAIITAWSALEAAMHLRLRAAGEPAGWGTMPRSMINELYSSGAFSSEEFANLEKLYQVRNQIVHGFSSPTLDASAVEFLNMLARRLLEESQTLKQPA